MIVPKILFNDEEFNEESLEELDVYTEPQYLQLKEGEEIQFVRFGYCEKIHRIKQFLHTSDWHEDARLVHENNETYGFVKGDKVATKDEITYLTGVPIPHNVKDFLFDGWFDEIKNNIQDLPYEENL